MTLPNAAGAAPVEEPIQTGVSGTPAPEAGATAPNADSTPEEELFFDATKVPEQLQPTFREMQAAWTKKAQEAAAARKQYEWLQEYGEPEEVQGFLGQFRDSEGVFNWWLGIAEELGIPQDRILALMSGEEGQTPPVQPGETAPPAAGQQQEDPYAKPMTVRDFAAYLQYQEQQAAEKQRLAAEEAQLDQAIKSVGLPDDPDIQRAILQIADGLPAQLGYEERVKRAYAKFNEFIETRAAAASQQSAANRANTPVGLGGAASPSGSEGPPKTMEEAFQRSKELISRANAT